MREKGREVREEICKKKKEKQVSRRPGQTHANP